MDSLLQATSSQFSELYGSRILRKNQIPQLKGWGIHFEALLQTIEDQDALVWNAFVEALMNTHVRL